LNKEFQTNNHIKTPELLPESTGIKRWGIKIITNEKASKGDPVQMKNFLLPKLDSLGRILSEIYPNMKPDRAIATLPTAFPYPLSFGSKLKWLP
jgi:hypothetical protein